MDLDQQGSPIELAKSRTSNFGRKAKIYGDGTPTRSTAAAPSSARLPAVTSASGTCTARIASIRSS